MKKILVFIFVVIAITPTSICQVNPNAIGLRGGRGNLGTGAELTYQKGIGEANRLELDIGLRSSSNFSYFTLTGIYHWVKPITDGLNWYAGPGLQAGYHSSSFNNLPNGIFIGIGGQLGLEFDFNDELDIPLLISIDTRPMFGFGVGFNYGGNLALRYTF
ncbi:MAG: hypothetical protein AB8B74_06100 [Crocinitomicaceae bacterium]